MKKLKWLFDLLSKIPFIKKYRLNKRIKKEKQAYEKAIEDANRLRKLTGFKYMVLRGADNNGYVVKRKQIVKEYIKRHKMPKNVNMQSIERTAIYVTA